MGRPRYERRGQAPTRQRFLRLSAKGRDARIPLPNRIRGDRLKPMKRIGFLSFGHWSDSAYSQVRSASDALLQSIELAVAAAAALQVRLRRMQGQVHGLAEMVAGERATLDVLQQFSAMLAAGREAALSYARLRLCDELRISGADERAIEDVVARLEPIRARASRLP